VNTNQAPETEKAERQVSPVRGLEVRRLGVVAYDEALAMQRRLVEERIKRRK
jgi:hypothetical protein